MVFGADLIAGFPTETEDHFADTLALVAEWQGKLVALGTAEPLEDGTAEIAFLVADECHGLGIGSLLLEHLAAAGRQHGIRRFTAEVLRENGPMREVLQSDHPWVRAYFHGKRSLMLQQKAN